MKYSIVSKGGRSRTGKDKKGSILHYVPGNVQNGFWCTPALCNAKPGSKGFGWLLITENVTDYSICQKCLKLSQNSINVSNTSDI